MTNMQIANNSITFIRNIEGEHFDEMFPRWEFSVVGNMIDVEYSKILLFRLDNNNNNNIAIRNIIIEILNLDAFGIIRNVPDYSRHEYLMVGKPYLVIV